MDKKNTILLTVIAVATLLVAVVGATFAYFSISGGSGTTNTTVTAQTPASNSTITVTEGDTELHLTLTAADMTQAKENTTYYAVTSESNKDAEIPEGSVYTTTPSTKSHANLGSVTISGAPEGAKYSCKFTVTVADEGTDLLSSLSSHSDAISLKLHGTGVDGAQGAEKVIPLDDLTSPISFDVDLNDGIAAGTYYADFAITNTEDPQEGYLQNKKLSVKLTTNIVCTEKTGD